MTSKAPLPAGVFELWPALDSGPAAAHKVCAAVLAAVESQHPRMTFNNSMRGLRSQSSRPLHEVRAWLKLPSTELMASKNGAYWALLKWQRGLDRMIDDTQSAHKAFGGDRQGRRAGGGFTHAERAAIYSEYRSRAAVGLNKALAEYAAQPRTPPAPDLDERDVRRARKRLCLSGLTLSEIQTLATGPAEPWPHKNSSYSKSGV